MSLLSGIQVACFDLFDTLIRVDPRRLPAVRWDGNEIRSTIPILHARLFEPRGVSLETLMVSLRGLWKELREELDAAPTAEGPWPEISAVDKYRRLAGRLDLGPGHDIETLASEVATLHHDTLVGAATPMEGAVEVLERVRANGISTVLVSNWDHAAAGPAMIEQVGLRDLLDELVISEAVGCRKPDPRIFEIALAPFDVEPQAALHVGDLARSDAWGAGRLGIRTVWINHKNEAYDQPAPEPTLTVGSLREMLDHI